MREMKKENARILNSDFEFVSGRICWENGVFTEITEEDRKSGAEEYIIPGLVDIHNHGCAGVNPMTADYGEINKMAEMMARKGTTTFLPTLLTEPAENIYAAAVNIKKAVETGVLGANIPGIHLEGPYFGAECIGANDVSNIRKPDIAEIEKIQDATDGFIKVISMDPTLCGAESFIRHFKDTIKISLGHTACDFDTAVNAFEWGAQNITHSFNGMKPMHHREPNMLAAAFNGDVFMELICDGFHVNPEMVKIAYKLAGSDRLVFISDSVFVMGLPDGEYEGDFEKCYVSDGWARLADGTIYGGMTPVFECVKKAVSFGIPFEKAVKCASLNAALAAGIGDKYGSIEKGKQADFLVLDSEFNIKDIYIKGERFDG